MYLTKKEGSFLDVAPVAMESGWNGGSLWGLRQKEYRLHSGQSLPQSSPKHSRLLFRFLCIPFMLRVELMSSGATGVKDARSEQFLKELRSAKVDGNKIALKSDWVFLNSPILFVRDHYAKFYEDQLNGLQLGGEYSKIVVSGTPGIGKLGKKDKRAREGGREEEQNINEIEQMF